ncbi:WecB/TagA/CpsF family glycosyltransferase [Candidatus Uhrbacteria bacterium]|nr:WecB/TagA/CpsF family glycosyltransferase [Candidatus Uhrbacteria bacterium]
MRIQLLGVTIDSISRVEAQQKLSGFFNDARQHTIVTPNPEFLLLAWSDEEFRGILNSADLALPDGVGLLFAARVFGVSIRERITGVAFIHAVCEEAAREGKTIFFLGGGEGVAGHAAEELQKRYANLVVVGAESGGVIERIAKGEWRYSDEKIFDTIRQAKPDVLFVALGQGKQEKWIADHCASLPSVKIAMGVGGALDYIAGAASWAPAWVRGAGLEWLWRLAHEPKRWRRIFNAVIVFPFVVLYERFFGK